MLAWEACSEPAARSAWRSAMVQLIDSARLGLPGGAVPDGLLEREGLTRALSRQHAVREGALRVASLLPVVSQHPRAFGRPVGVFSLEDSGSPAVQLPAPVGRQDALGDLLDERMLETVLGTGPPAGETHESVTFQHDHRALDVEVRFAHGGEMGEFELAT